MQLGMKAKIKALIRIEGDGVAGCSYGFISGTLFFFLYGASIHLSIYESSHYFNTQ